MVKLSLTQRDEECPVVNVKLENVKRLLLFVVSVHLNSVILH